MPTENPSPSSALPVSRRQLMRSGSLLAAAGFPFLARAQDKSLATMLLPFPAGGAGDLLARTLAEKLKSETGRNIVVDNRPGGATRIAGELLRNGPSDGSMVLLSPIDPMFIVPAIFPGTRYDPRKEFKPITDVAALQFGLAVPANSPFKSLAQFLQAARLKSLQADIGISLVGSLLHFLAMELVSKAGTKGVIVPYKGGGPMLTDLIGGQIPAGMDATTTFTEQHRAGKIRVLAVSGDRRASGMPGVPTFSESGFPELVATSAYAVYARANTPDAAMARWNQALRKVLALPDVQAKLLAAGYDLVSGSDTSQVQAYTEKAAARWLPVIYKSGFKGE